MLLLAIDTSSGFCSTCLYDSESLCVLAKEERDIGRGHAEVLLTQIEECLEEAKLQYNDLQRICVSRGPGSFTGVRVGMASARGLGLSLGIPVVGVSTLEACEHLALQESRPTPLLSLLDAKREEVYCKLSGETDASLRHVDQLADLILDNKVTTVAGSGALQIDQATSAKLNIAHTLGSYPIEIYAKIGASSEPSSINIEPLYLRSADAKRQSGFVLTKQKNEHV